MKYSKVYFLLLIYFLLSCGDKEPIHNESFLIITPNNFTLDLDTETKTIFYTVKFDKSIQVTSNSPDWCNASISNVSIDNLKIKVSENESFEDRKAIVTISNGLQKIEITIIQMGVKPVISVDKNSVTVQFGNPEFVLEVISNIPIDFDLPDWIFEKEGNTWQKGKKKYAFTLSPLPNELSSRKETVFIKPKNLDHSIEPISISVTQKAITKIIAHRGYWQMPHYPQNSLASLQRAIDIGVYGSELDVWITKDDVLVINHDAKISGIHLESSTFSDLRNVRLSNGETVPTLEECLDIIKQQQQTKLIIEIKPHSTATNENRAVAAVIEMVDRKEISHLVDYISFSQNICQKLIANNYRNRVAYLNGNIAPETLKTEGYWGLDYSSTVLKTHPNWLQAAKDLGLTTNVWTVNDIVDFEYFISMDVDFITTDYPQTLKDLLSARN